MSRVSRSYLATYLGSPSALVLLCIPIKYIAYESTIEATKSNFFPFIDPPQAYPCLEREVAHATMRHMPSSLAVYANFVDALCLRAAPYLPPFTAPSTKDPGQTFIRLGIFIFRSNETTKRVTSYRRKGDGGKRDGARPVYLSWSVTVDRSVVLRQSIQLRGVAGDVGRETRKNRLRDPSFSTVATLPCRDFPPLGCVFQRKKRSSRLIPRRWKRNESFEKTL